MALTALMTVRLEVTGFVIEGRRIITNAHSVEYGSIIQLRKRGDDTKWVAQLLAYGPECDLAVLTVKDDKFWEGLEALSFGKLPALLDDVSVVGYPIGGESLSVTAGVVSRIELQEYAQGGETLLAIQVSRHLTRLHLCCKETVFTITTMGKAIKDLTLAVLCLGAGAD